MVLNPKFCMRVNYYLILSFIGTREAVTEPEGGDFVSVGVQLESNAESNEKNQNTKELYPTEAVDHNLTFENTLKENDEKTS